MVGTNMFAYCGNNPIDFCDLSGMRYILSTSVNKETATERAYSGNHMCGRPATTAYYSESDAAMAFANETFSSSMYVRHEYISTIYSYQYYGRTVYRYTTPQSGSPHSADVSSSVPEGTSITAYAHTHPIYNEFSRKDKDVAIKMNAYVVGPNRLLQKYDATTMRISPHGSVSPRQLLSPEKNALRNQFQASWDNHVASGCKKGCGLMRWPNE